MLEVNFEQNINDIIEKRADCANVNTIVTQEILDMQLEKLRKTELIDINQFSEEVVT